MDKIWGAFFLIMSFIHSELEVGRSNSEEDSVVPHIMKLWKQEEKNYKNGIKEEFKN